MPKKTRFNPSGNKREHLTPLARIAGTAGRVWTAWLRRRSLKDLAHQPDWLLDDVGVCRQALRSKHRAGGNENR